MEYRVVVVDDEPYIAESTALFLKMQYQDEVDVHLFHAPREAMDFLTNRKTDLLIADIRMPGLNGLELMKQAVSLWPMCQVILLTAHPEFDYVYEAIRYQNVSYVLKLEGHAALKEAVDRAIERLKTSARQEALFEQAREAARGTLSYLQRELLMDMVHGVAYSPDKLARAQAQLQLPLDLMRPMALCTILMHLYSSDATLMERVEQMNLLSALARQHLPDDVKFLPVPLDRLRILYILQSAGEVDRMPVRLDGLLENMQRASAGQLNIPFSAAYVSFVPDYLALRAAYERINSAQAAQAVGGQQQWLLDVDRMPPAAASSALDRAWVERARQWRHAFESGDPAAEELFSQLTGALRQAETILDIAFMELYQLLGTQLSAIVRNMKFPAGALDARAMYKLYNVESHRTPADAARYLTQLVARIHRLRQESASETLQAVVAEVTGYIRSHLSEDISLTRLSDLVGMNASYLSRVFKQMTGRNLIAYISEEKMEYARALLGDQSLKLQEIGARLGFSNPAYFSFYFKKNAGMTPTEYRAGLSERPRGGG